MCVIKMNNTIPETVNCILCHGMIIYRDGDKLKFREHMRYEHGAFYDLDFLLASSLMETDQKESLARTVQTCLYGEAERKEVKQDEEEETLKENTNYDKDDQSNQPELEHSEKPKMKMKKKPGRKKAGSVVGEDSLSVNTKQEVEETSFSDQEPLMEGVEEQGLETGGSGERFLCQVESCGKSYNTKGNRMTHEKKAHGILGPRAAKRQRMSVSTEDTPAESENAHSDTAEAEQQPEQEVFTEAPANSSSSFLTDTSLGEDDLTEDSEGQEENNSLTTESVAQNPGQTQLDLSSSTYFAKNPKMLASARGSTIELFEVNPVLPEGWRQRVLEVISKKGDKLVSRHYLSPELKVLRSGMAVVEYLRIKGEMDLEQLKQLAKHLNVADKKFQSLFN